MQQDNARNTIIFIVCAVAIFILYDLFVLRPNVEKQRAEQQRAPRARQAAEPRPCAHRLLLARHRGIVAPW